MRFSEMTTKQIRAAKSELQKRLYPVLQTTRIQKLEDGSVILEGGTFPAFYNAHTEELSIWGRSSRNSGGEMTVNDLRRAETIVHEFYIEYMEGDSE